MKKLILLSSLLVITNFIKAEIKPCISINTDKVQLVLKVKEDGRLYQTYLGEKLNEKVNLNNLDMPRGTVSSVCTNGNEVYPVMGTEDYFDPALEVRHWDGNPTSFLKYDSHTENPSREARKL